MPLTEWNAKIALIPQKYEDRDLPAPREEELVFHMLTIPACALGTLSKDKKDFERKGIPPPHLSGGLRIV